MDGDRQLERLYERVTLIRSVGSRRYSQLCIMSFVALLAGERHSDHPRSASPLIRSLAIPINDAMPDKERQRLKPFAPRILGTNDGRDEARIEVLRQFLSERLLPRIRSDRAAEQVEGRTAEVRCFSGRVAQRDLEASVERLLAQIENGVSRHGQSLLGATVGELLDWCMQGATTQERRSWYRNEAVLLLDRLCDVGAEARSPSVPDSRIAQAEERLEDTWLSWMRRLWLTSTKTSEPYLVGGPQLVAPKETSQSETAQPQLDIVKGTQE